MFAVWAVPGALRRLCQVDTLVVEPLVFTVWAIARDHLAEGYALAETVQVLILLLVVVHAGEELLLVVLQVQCAFPLGGGRRLDVGCVVALVVALLSVGVGH